METWINTLESALLKLFSDYQKNRNLIITEGDLECLIFSYAKLRGLPIHSQISWFKDDKKSGFELDLTILNEEKLSVEKFDEIDRLIYDFNYPHKGYFYDGETIGIELKFIRNADKFNHNILCDIIKINESIIPSKVKNINNGVYKISTLDTTKFYIVLGFKEERLLKIALSILQEYIKIHLRYREMIKIFLFCPNCSIEI
ncbi:hypothetical protein [Chryseobacterium mucoviscidosis]|uniref:Uncharacterized protein n=1 Tax=Chryseobacterium mucoviscidosis TaxID=1945581 RepID=A0A202BRB1_9FLAO|nr:hypothetical protein [Chryseobacterium mucoviscidosis]OVE53980.1 hypothetical protein B0E34_20345 [Chryseobacterium mucoviscidosis]